MFHLCALNLSAQFYFLYTLQIPEEPGAEDMPM